MEEEELFAIIDAGIDIFKQNEGFGKGIRVSKIPYSDWLKFNWRQLTWTENRIEYLIEIYPSFNKAEEIASWTLYTAANFNLGNKRYHIKKSFAEETTLDHIAANILQLLADSYRFITTIPENDIPFAVPLS